jgi:glycosyltransferase involved in cell wall biosynthesis
MNKIAVITPYYKESDKQLLKCYESVRSQTIKNVTHFFVSDGHPNRLIDVLPGDHTVHLKIPPCADYGDTPRGIGAAIASAQGYAAICFLDADCWYDPTHLEDMLDARGLHSAPIITSLRNLYRPNGTFMRVDNESDGVLFNDTNCYMFFTESYNMLRSWLFKPKSVSALGDRFLWAQIKKNGLNTASTLKATVNYTTTFAAHYTAMGEDPPADSKVFVEINGERKSITYQELNTLRNENSNIDRINGIK